MVQQVFKRYKYTSKTFWAGSVDKKNPLEDFDERATEWINSELSLCGANAVIISVNTEFIPAFAANTSNRVLISLCIGIN